MSELFLQPEQDFFEKLKKVKTPAIVYYKKGIYHTIHRLNEDFGVYSNISINLAVKTTYYEPLLSMYSQSVDGCDVASIGEFQLVQDKNFKRITSTSPYYSKSDMEFFLDKKIVIDVNSISQLIQVGEIVKLRRSKFNSVGLRIQIPLLDELNTEASFGKDSRFGIDWESNKTNILKVIEKYDLNIVSLHVHTGQNTTGNLIFKTNYLLNIANKLKTITTINLGGGFLYLYSDYIGMKKCLEKLNKKIMDWESSNERSIDIIFEPGAAFLAGNGFLLTKVVDLKEDNLKFAKILQCDASFWNMSPWVSSYPINLTSNSILKESYLIVGTTMYENDIRGIHRMPETSINDILLFPGYGAYTGNIKNFNLLEKVDMVII